MPVARNCHVGIITARLDTLFTQILNQTTYGTAGVILPPRINGEIANNTALRHIFHAIALNKNVRTTAARLNIYTAATCNGDTTFITARQHRNRCAGADCAATQAATAQDGLTTDSPGRINNNSTLGIYSLVNGCAISPHKFKASGIYCCARCNTPFCCLQLPTIQYCARSNAFYFRHLKAIRRNNCSFTQAILNIVFTASIDCVVVCRTIVIFYNCTVIIHNRIIRYAAINICSINTLSIHGHGRHNAVALHGNASVIQGYARGQTATVYHQMIMIDRDIISNAT
ncbi:hypothetical protein APS_2763 [Acetobacter pasteurianus subsp. pasteurianus LMG 1262 = NBRC 106471]|nr:hypothetical protein APS_2763 [Acetobacter pasteurianus subsp. pasteurianus LMG 1262 = NBRC 106471]